MMNKKLKRFFRIRWRVLVVLIWLTYVYEILFTDHSQSYGVKEWGLFGGLTFTIGVEIWSLFHLSKKPKKEDFKNG
jgi:hypothetical protein